MKRLLLKGLEFYSAYSATKPARCRYTPTCSQYAQEAIASHGAAKGTYLSIRRVLRCSPLGSFGIDPVPEKELS